MVAATRIWKGSAILKELVDRTLNRNIEGAREFQLVVQSPLLLFGSCLLSVVVSKCRDGSRLFLEGDLVPS